MNKKYKDLHALYSNKPTVNESEYEELQEQY